MSLKQFTKKALKSVYDYEDLMKLGISEYPECDISYRGGYLGFLDKDIARVFGIDKRYLPSKVGVHCNYLGGGLRGSIITSDFHESVYNHKNYQKLANLLERLVEIYKNIETDAGIPDDAIEGIGRVNQRSTY